MMMMVIEVMKMIVDNLNGDLRNMKIIVMIMMLIIVLMITRKMTQISHISFCNETTLVSLDYCNG